MFSILVFYHRKQANRRVLLVVLVGFYIISIPFTADRIMKWIEAPYLAGNSLQDHYDVVIVLAGMVNLKLSKGGYIEFGSGVDRILAGISLVRQGIGERLIISGGSGLLFFQHVSEAELLRTFAMQWGLSSDQIIIEGKSRNTHENAVNTVELIRSHGCQSIVLVTSAFHMRRAEAAFRKQGIFPDTYPVDFYSDIRQFSFIPSAQSISMNTIVIRELVGLVLYRLMDYI